MSRYPAWRGRSGVRTRLPIPLHQVEATTPPSNWSSPMSMVVWVARICLACGMATAFTSLARMGDSVYCRRTPRVDYFCSARGLALHRIAACCRNCNASPNPVCMCCWDSVRARHTNSCMPTSFARSQLRPLVFSCATFIHGPCQQRRMRAIVLAGSCSCSTSSMHWKPATSFIFVGIRTWSMPGLSAPKQPACIRVSFAGKNIKRSWSRNRPPRPRDMSHG